MGLIIFRAADNEVPRPDTRGAAADRLKPWLRAHFETRGRFGIPEMASKETRHAQIRR
jgi:hypothetical protein